MEPLDSVLKLSHRILIVFALLAFISVGSAPSPSFAATQTKAAKAKTSKSKKAAVKKAKKRHSRTAAIERPQARHAALVVDASNGRVLYEEHAADLRYPASLTKMMTLYLTFDALKHNRFTLDSTLPITAKAAGQPQTNISLTQGERLPMRIAISSVVVRSANDSAMVLAEAIGGTEWNFALMMTQKARELGMKDTVFHNPNGLPDNSQHTTAYDLAKLAIALRRDFPDYYPYFKLDTFDYKGVTYPGHNRVMARYDGVDGVKTGFIRASGFNLVTSVRKNGVNLVAVVMGGSTAQARDDEMIALLDRTFAQLATEKKTVASQEHSDSTDGNTTAAFLYPAVPPDETSPAALEPAAGGPHS